MFGADSARALAPLGGEIVEGKGLNIGYFAQQELDVLRSGDTPMEHMIALAKEVIAANRGGWVNAREQDLRNFLGTFNFSGDMVKQPVGTMSGGEKARLVLCMIVWQRPNLLLLDEPTNHLDAESVAWLERYLREYTGCIMLVTHDPEIAAVTPRRIEIRDGKIAGAFLCPGTGL